MNGVTNAYGIYLPKKDRWFNGWGKKGLMKSAWSLAGAKLFVPRGKYPPAEDADISKHLEKLHAKGHVTQVRLITATGIAGGEA